MEEDFCYISNVTSFAILQGATLALLSTRNFLVCCFKKTIGTFISFTKFDLLFQRTIFIPYKAKFNVNRLAMWQFFFWAANKGQPTILHIFMGLHNKDIFCFLNIMDCLCIQMTYRLSVALDFFWPFRPHFI